MSKRYILLGIGLVAVAVIGSQKYLSYKRSNETDQPANTNTAPTDVNGQPLESIGEPSFEFSLRVTKKPFGIYVDPSNSPVQPERFKGYHTGVDVEYEDNTPEVPVYAVADGEVVYSSTASGYGGVVVQTGMIYNINRSVVYGHLKPSSLATLGPIKKGDQIGVLGEGYTDETDGERKHLHFAVLADDRIDLLGYVQNSSQLSGWVDPLALY